MRKNRNKREAGSAIALFAVGMVALLGFVSYALDYSLLLADANRLQRACDAAALAGAMELPDTSEATSKAVATAAANGVTVEAADVTIPAGNTSITVSADTSRAFLLGSVIGMGQWSVTRQATSEQASVKGIGSGALPLVMTEDDYNSHSGGVQFMVKLGRNQEEDFIAGVMLGVDIKDGSNSKSVAHWETAVETGMSSAVEGDSTQIENSLNADESNQGKRLVDAITKRLQNIGSEAYMMIAPSKPQTNGNSYHTITGIAAIEILSVDQPDKKGAGYLTLKIIPTKGLSSTDPNIVLGDSSVDTGLYILRLVDDF